MTATDSSVAAPDTTEPRCLNCDLPLTGAFCSTCGQRAVPPHPTVRELVGDAWVELTGYDGRIARTVRALLFHPGRLTREFMEGHRARYISPVRLYLTASVIYFVVAIAAPNMPTSSAAIQGPGGIRIGVTTGENVDILDPKVREDLKKEMADAPGVLQPVLRAIVEDPLAFRRRMIETMPRVFFAMLPIFAAITALFFRRRVFPTHLTFAAHVHAFAFIVGTLSEIAKFPRSTTLAAIASGITGIAVLAYVLLAFKVVYQERWGRTLGKAVGIAFLYLLSAIPAFIIIIAWASMS